MQGVQNAEHVIEHDFGDAFDGEGSEHPGDAQEDHDGERAPELRRCHGDLPSGGLLEPRLDDDARDDEEDDGVGDDDEAARSHQRRVVRDLVALRQEAAETYHVIR